jgi:hypothetical protein
MDFMRRNTIGPVKNAHKTCEKNIFKALYENLRSDVPSAIHRSTTRFSRRIPARIATGRTIRLSA